MVGKENILAFLEEQTKKMKALEEDGFVIWQWERDCLERAWKEFHEMEEEERQLQRFASEDGPGYDVWDTYEWDTWDFFEYLFM